MADEASPTPADQRDGRPEWPDGLVSARKALELGLPGWPQPGDDPVPPPTPVPAGRGGAQRIPRPYTVEAGGPPPWAHLDPADLRLSLADVRKAMAAADPPQRSQREVAPDAAGRPAAVLAPLYDDRDGSAVVVLTRRTWGLSTHEGEVSFPGGRVEVGETTAEAALREAKEEVDLDPSSVEIFGELDHLNTLTSNSYIVPYVGALPGRPVLAPNPGEVAAVLHVPLAELTDPAIFREEIWPFPNGFQRSLYFFELAGDTVWGMTAALLRQLLGMVTGTLGAATSAIPDEMRRTGMRLLLVAKSAYSGTSADGRDYPAILSGMTVGFVRGLVRTALARGDPLTYVFPAFTGPSEVTFVDPEDPLPGEVVARPFWDGPITKSAVSAAPVQFTATVADICRDAATRPDVAVFVYPFPLLNLAAPILRAAGVPWVATFRGGDAYRWLAEPEADAHQHLVWSAYRDALQGCASVTAASSWLADVARATGVPVDGIVGSPPPGDGVAPEVTADRSQWKQQYLDDGDLPVGGEALRTDRLWLLWSGRLSKDKRPDLAIDAYARVASDRWQLVIAGEGDRSLLPDPLPAGVGHVFVPPRSLPRILRAADAALHTAVPGSFIDSRPSSVLAASSYGLPCITVRAEGVGGTDECVSPEVLRQIGVPADGGEDAIVAGIAASVDRLSDDDIRVGLSADVSEWATRTGLWSGMDTFLDLTERSITKAK